MCANLEPWIALVTLGSWSHMVGYVVTKLILAKYMFAWYLTSKLRLVVCNGGVFEPTLQMRKAGILVCLRGSRGEPACNTHVHARVNVNAPYLSVDCTYAGTYTYTIPLYVLDTYSTYNWTILNMHTSTCKYVVIDNQTCTIRLHKTKTRTHTHIYIHIHTKSLICTYR